MRNYLIILLIYAAAPLAIFSADVSKTEKKILDNASHEMIECVSYYNIVSGVTLQSGNKKSSVIYKNASKKALNLSIDLLASSGKNEEIVKKVIASRFSNESQSQKDEIENDISNISILIGKYNTKCQNYLNNPNILLTKWMNKINKKHNND